MLKIVDSFTTQDGEWFPSNKPYSITKEAAEKYKGIPGAGAAHHIFVLAPLDAFVVEFNTENRQNKTERFPQAQAGRWVSHPIFEAYDPDSGEQGAWHVWIDGERVTEKGIGLPHGNHVSTFLVVEQAIMDGGPGPTVPPVQGKDKYHLYRNGALVWES